MVTLVESYPSPLVELSRNSFTGKNIVPIADKPPVVSSDAVKKSGRSIDELKSTFEASIILCQGMVKGKLAYEGLKGCANDVLSQLKTRRDNLKDQLGAAADEAAKVAVLDKALVALTVYKANLKAKAKLNEVY
jgi:hypothetical protein